MAESSLAKKLKLKPGQRAILVNAPDGYLNALSPLPAGDALKAGSQLEQFYGSA